MLLLDGPFGALEAKVRKELRRWLRRLHDDLHLTSIFVTHDQEEALELAGRVEQIGSSQDVWDHPASQDGRASSTRVANREIGNPLNRFPARPIGQVLAPGVVRFMHPPVLELAPRLPGQVNGSA